MSSPREAIIVDFDGTLFNGPPGVVEFVRVNQDKYDIVIVTSRRYGNGINHVQRFLYDNRIKPAAIFPGLGQDSEHLKARMVKKIQQKSSIVLAIDNNPAVVLEYEAMGIHAIQPCDILNAWQSE